MLLSTKERDYEVTEDKNLNPQHLLKMCFQGEVPLSSFFCCHTCLSLLVPTLLLPRTRIPPSLSPHPYSLKDHFIIQPDFFHSIYSRLSGPPLAKAFSTIQSFQSTFEKKQPLCVPLYTHSHSLQQ